MIDDAQRQAILQLLAKHDGALRGEFPREFVKANPCLLLGRHYGQSPVIYFSLNPAYPRQSDRCDLSSTEGWNVPFFNRPELNRQYIYLQNCQKFFASDKSLFRWMNGAVTSAFLVPWRTRNMAELKKLNRVTGGRMFEYARDIARTVIEHHRAELLLVAGKAALPLMASLHLLDCPIDQIGSAGPGGSYQWSKCRAFFAGRPLTILQIPHFSRANSSQRMEALRLWLQSELTPFGWPEPYTRE